MTSSPTRVETCVVSSSVQAPRLSTTTESGEKESPIRTPVSLAIPVSSPYVTGTFVVDPVTNDLVATVARLPGFHQTRPVVSTPPVQMKVTSSLSESDKRHWELSRRVDNIIKSKLTGPSMVFMNTDPDSNDLPPNVNLGEIRGAVGGEPDLENLGAAGGVNPQPLMNPGVATGAIPRISQDQNLRVTQPEGISIRDSIMRDVYQMMEQQTLQLRQLLDDFAQSQNSISQRRERVEREFQPQGAAYDPDSARSSPAPQTDGFDFSAPPPPPRGWAPPNRGFSLPGRNNQTDPMKPMIKPPDMKLGTFSGDVKEYPLFKSLFKHTVDRFDMPNETKAVYLYQALQGDAKALVMSLVNQGSLDNSTLKQMWDILEKRYGGPLRRQVNKLDMIRQHGPLKDLQYKSMYKYYTVIKEIVEYCRTEAPGHLVDQASLLYMNAKANLGHEAGRKYVEFRQKFLLDDNIKTLLRWIEDTCAMEEELMIVSKLAKSTDRSGSRNSSPKNVKKTLPTANAFLTQEEEETGNDQDQDESRIFSETEETPEQSPIEQLITTLKTVAFSGQPQKGKSPNRSSGKPQSGSSYSSRGRSRSRSQSPNRARTSRTFSPGRKPSSLKTSVNSKECGFCKAVDKHAPEECPKLSTIGLKSRWNICVQEKMCYHCLRKGHAVKACLSRKDVKCGKEGCQRYHHPRLHNPASKDKVFMTFQFEEVVNESELYANFDEPEEETVTVFKSQFLCGTAIQTMVCYIRALGKTFPIIAILDTGANISSVDKRFADKMKLQILSDKQMRNFRYLDRTERVESRLVAFEILSQDQKVVQNIVGWTVKDLSEGSEGVKWEEEIPHYEHLKDIVIPDSPSPCVPTVLIGVDYAHLFIQMDIRVGQLDQPVAIKTALGWAFFGQHGAREGQHTMLRTESKEWQKLHDQVSRYFELETLGLQERERPFAKGFFGGPKPREKWTKSEIEADAKMIVKHHVHPVEHFSAAMPWIQDPAVVLQGNFNSIKARQANTMSANSLKKFGTDFEEYTNALKKFADKGYIERVPKSDEGKGWYLPHRPVVNRAKASTPVRPVFDAGAKFRGISINSNTDPGPNRLNDIFLVLLRFRRFQYALTADISEMFLRVRLIESDKQYFRFLIGDEHWQWIDMSFGGNAFPNVSQKVLEEVTRLFGKNHKEAVISMIMSIYMDDMCDSRPTQEAIYVLATSLQALLQHADMQLGKYYTNAAEIVHRLDKDRVAKEISFKDREAVFESSKVLGMHWQADTDQFTFRSKYKSVEDWLDKLGIPANANWTKRTVLKAVASTFDPLGLISPFVILGRILIQDLWAVPELDWDTSIPDNLQTRWLEWLNQLFELTKIQIPRWVYLTYENMDSAELHVFCDASENAYATTVFIRVNSVGGADTSLVTAKARVSPKKNETTSRLELVACVVGTRLLAAVNSGYEIPKERVFYWTDSRNALCWIHSPAKTAKVYVQNRIGEIQRVSDIHQWRHVPTDQNPADIATRPITVEELASESLWWSGPDFLRNSQESWPAPFDPSGTKLSEEALIEMKQESQILVVRVEQPLSEFIDLVDKVSVGRLWNGLRDVLNVLEKVVRATELMRKRGHLVNARNRARAVLLIGSQKRSFEHEIRRLETGGKVPPELNKYSPFFDRFGIMRARTRISRLDEVPLETKQPIILHGRERMTELLVTQLHIELEHPVSANLMLAKAYEQFVIVGMSRLLKRIASSCVLCRRLKAKACQQQMADLPAWRFEKPLRAFSKIGLDFAGPFWVKMGRGIRRKQMFILVITCLQIRAVHFEVCENQTTGSVINALSRFSALRGVPDVIFSDNQTSFRAADKDLVEFVSGIDFEKLRGLSGFMSKDITWKFNTPLAPHQGGIYEIMVKAMKRAIRVLMDGQHLDEDSFRTVVYRSAALLNSRPLSQKIDEDSGQEEILTPNSFLVGNVSTQLTSGQHPERFDPRKAWKRLNESLELVWSRFLKEIVPQLQSRSKWADEFQDLKEGDVVLLIEPGTPRGLWRLGRVVEPLPSGDGKIRNVLVHSMGKNKERPITRLVRLFSPEE